MNERQIDEGIERTQSENAVCRAHFTRVSINLTISARRAQAHVATAVQCARRSSFVKCMHETNGDAEVMTMCNLHFTMHSFRRN